MFNNTMSTVLEYCQIGAGGGAICRPD